MTDTATDHLAELAEVDAELAVYWADMEKLRERHKPLRDRREVAIAGYLGTLTDEQILTDEQVRLWACNEAWGNSAAHNRIRALAAPTIPEVVVHGVDGRDEYRALLRPTVILEADSDIAVVTAELALWSKVWLMGRPDLPIDVLEWSLSAGGSYGITWCPEARDASLRRNGGDEIATGDLHQVLAYVAKNHPYNHGRDLHDSDWD